MSKPQQDHSKDGKCTADSKRGKYIRIQVSKNHALLSVNEAQTELIYFEGIPYAEPPIGARRFAKPAPLSKPLKDVYDATQISPWCMQLTKLGSYVYVEGQEDCLYLNVYVPKRDDASKVHSD